METLDLHSVNVISVGIALSATVFVCIYSLVPAVKQFSMERQELRSKADDARRVQTAGEGGSN